MIVAIIQARLSSARLPGKVMKPVLGRPMLERQIERVHRARLVQRIVVATSDHGSDDALVQFCRDIGVDCVQGALEDVLDRYYRAALACAATAVVRLTGDCPLIDPQVIDKVIDVYQGSGVDYASNTLTPTYPDGLDVEVFSFSALESAWREAALPSQREHVTPFIYGNPQRFRLTNVWQDRDLSALRWTVDNPEDYELVCRIYEALYPGNPVFSLEDVLKLLEREPALQRLNIQYQRNEGYMKSLRQDQPPGRDGRRPR